MYHLLYGTFLIRIRKSERKKIEEEEKKKKKTIINQRGLENNKKIRKPKEMREGETN